MYVHAMPTVLFFLLIEGSTSTKSQMSQLLVLSISSVYPFPQFLDYIFLSYININNVSNIEIAVFLITASILIKKKIVLKTQGHIKSGEVTRITN